MYIHYARDNQAALLEQTKGSFLFSVTNFFIKYERPTIYIYKACLT